MKVKDIARTANVAWSPAQQYPVYMAAGTAAQQLDATFSTSAALEIYALNLADQSMDMEQAATVNTDHRFHSIVWGKHGMGNNTLNNGMIVGGTDNGGIYMYNAEKLLEGSDAFIGQLEKHAGAVKALDFNPFQGNLLASGASDSEIFIWDLNKPTSPMTPGAKSQPPDDISCVAWNRQVQHILASTNPGGRCVVWDLKKNEPIIKVTDHSSRIRCKAVAWHPEVATQLVLASEDDYSPVIQMWDLRFATSPLKVLHKHERGVLSVAWCPQDPDLLLSCAKDNRILVWNPNSNVPGGEVVYELPTSSQWSFDVQFCPRNPAVISSSSFDGHVSIYSLMGGQKVAAQSNKQTDQLASSFGTDGFGQQQQQEAQTPAEPMLLKKPPKWLRTPVGASFGFGGKLISYASDSKQYVHVSQVVTEHELVNRSNVLEEALTNGNFVEFCNTKITKAQDDTEKEIWNFLKVNFEKEPRNHFIGLLGHDPHELARKVAVATGAPLGLTNGMPGAVDAEELAARMTHLSAGSRGGSEAKLGSGNDSPAASKTPNNSVGESDAAAAVFDAISAGGTVEVENQEEAVPRSGSPFTISRTEDTDGLVSQAILTGNFEAAVEMCLHDDRMADAILLAIAGGPELLASTQRKYFKKTKSQISRLISSVVTKDLKDIVHCCELDNWKEALTALLTYATPKEFSTLCDSLGARLEAEHDGKYSTQAFLCYICAGNVDRLVSCWSRITHNASAPANLQDLVEKVMILRKAVEVKSGSSNAVSSSILADKLSEYAYLLAAQGKLMTATNYLGDSTQPKIVSLRDRLNRAQGSTASYSKAAPSVNNYQQNTFNTTTVSSSQFYNSQVSATAQPSQYTTSTYSPKASEPQMAYNSQTNTTSNTTGAANSEGAAGMHAKLSGPRKYPSYQQSGMQQYYAQTPQTSQPAYAPQPKPETQQQPMTGMYNPGNYSAPTSAPSSQTPTGQYQQPGPVSAYQPYQPTATPPVSVAPVPPRPKADQGAWNDPPVLKPKKEPSSEYIAPQPITAPIVGAPVEEMPSQHPGAGQGYNPYNGQQQQVSKGKPAAPQEAPKAPIPAEHQILCDTYDGLLKRCSEKAANSAQTRRKLEDINRKLNILYDKLREGMVSAMILQGLHELAQFIEQYDYQQGLMVHTRLVSSGNFSEISAFMPGLKVLLQVATQLRV